MNLIRFHYAVQCPAAHIAEPIMRAIGCLRFSKVSRDSCVINALISRVWEDLLDDSIRPSNIGF
jgi:hypothetical protein